MSAECIVIAAETIDEHRDRTWPYADKPSLEEKVDQDLKKFVGTTLNFLDCDTISCKCQSLSIPFVAEINVNLVAMATRAVF